MAIQNDQNNTDQNMNQGGYVGEVEASIGGFDSSSSSSSNSSATASLARGDNNVSSGSSSAGKIGLVKGLIFGSFLLVGFFIFEKWGR